MDEADKVWMNGTFVDWSDAKVHVLTHALHYGTAVFEGIRCYETKHGAVVFRLQDHVRRLLNSAKIYMMPLPYTADTIVQAVKDLVRVNRMNECYIRPIAYYDYGVMGLNPLSNRVSLAIASWKWGAYLGEDASKRGVRCTVSSWRRIDPQTLPPQAKSSANYANGVLAKIEAVKSGYDEAIMLNSIGLVCEGTGENIFRVKNHCLTTPPASAGILRGITRDTITQLAADLNIDHRYLDISREELYTADELFLCGTAAELTPINEVDGRKIGDGDWPVTRRLQSAYSDAVHGVELKHSQWLEHLR
jgi:branched-chain amino acid aminotransferase